MQYEGPNSWKGIIWFIILGLPFVGFDFLSYLFTLKNLSLTLKVLLIVVVCLTWLYGIYRLIKIFKKT